MNRKWLAKPAAFILAFTMLIAGCAKPPAPTTPAAPGGGAAPAPGGGAPAAGAFKVGMSTDIGGLNDQSFNQSAYQGLQRLQKDVGYQIKAIESKRNEDYEPNFRSLIDLKMDVIWGIGFLMQDALTKVAKENPSQKFGIIDTVVDAPNVASVTFREEEGAFLMGIIAAKATKSKKVGFVGGMDIDVIHHFDAGFQAGVKATDPSVQVVRVYAGSFTDSAKGKDVALQMIKDGADVVFHAAGGTGAGVIEAAKSQGKYAIGVDQDQNAMAPDTVISSMVKRVDQAVYDVSKAAQAGNFPGGKTTTMGLKENGVGYPPTTLWAKMPADTKALVDKWSAAISGGQVTVPNDLDKLKSWTVPKI